MKLENGQKNCEKLFDKVFDRVQLPFPDSKIEIFSDGHDDYTNTILNTMQRVALTMDN